MEYDDFEQKEGYIYHLIISIAVLTIIFENLLLILAITLIIYEWVSHYTFSELNINSVAHNVWQMLIDYWNGQKSGSKSIISIYFLTFMYIGSLQYIIKWRIVNVLFIFSLVYNCYYNQYYGYTALNNTHFLNWRLIIFICSLLLLIAYTFLSIGYKSKNSDKTLIKKAKSLKPIPMFRGNASISFKSTKLSKEVFDVLEEELSVIGTAEISEKGNILFNAANFNGLLTKTIVEGSVREKEGKYLVNIDYNSSLTILGWIILVAGIFLYLTGLLVLIAPFLASQEVKRKVAKSFENVGFEFK